MCTKVNFFEAHGPKYIGGCDQDILVLQRLHPCRVHADGSRRGPCGGDEGESSFSLYEVLKWGSTTGTTRDGFLGV